MSVASSVALVSERNSNATVASPQLHPSVSGDQDPAAALWGSHQELSQVRFFFNSMTSKFKGKNS